MNERQFQVQNEQQRDSLCRFLGKQPVPFLAQVGPLRKPRTLTQNARLWALHTLAADHTGYSAEEMHEFALCRFFGYAEKEVTDPLTGEIQTKRIPNKRSSARDTKEFRAFMDATEAWYADEFGTWLE